jgi:hypothetical protein
MDRLSTCLAVMHETWLRSNNSHVLEVVSSGILLNSLIYTRGHRVCHTNDIILLSHCDGADAASGTL